MYCRKCGKQIGDEDKFCKYCGCPAVGEISMEENRENYSNSAENAGLNVGGVQEFIGQKSFWLKEQLIAVIASAVMMFIPSLEFSVGRFGDRYSIWTLWGLVQKASYYSDLARNAQLADDVSVIKIMTMVLILFSGITALFGTKYIYAVLEKNGDEQKEAKRVFVSGFVTMITVFTYACIMNGAYSWFIDDGLYHSGNGGYFSVTLIVVAELSLIVFNLLYVIPKKTDTKPKMLLPDWADAEKEWRKKCPSCGTVFNAKRSRCPQCSSDCSGEKRF